MTAERFDTAAEPEWNVDELAALTGFTVRTIRYYATLGLVPAPERRGRLAFYGEAHRARLDLMRTLQEQGLSLSAIEQQLSRIPSDAPVSELEMRRALVSSWAPMPHEVVDRAELERRAGRALSADDISKLERLAHVTRSDNSFELGATFRVGVELLDFDFPEETLIAAGDAIRSHMDALALELRDILRHGILEPMRARNEATDTAEFAAAMTRLRQLTFDAVVGNFQEAANGLVDGSLLGQGGRA